MLFLTTLTAVLGFLTLVAWVAHYFANGTKMKGRDMEALKERFVNRGIIVFLCVIMSIHILCLLAGADPVHGIKKVLLVVMLIATALNSLFLWMTWKEYKAKQDSKKTKG